MVHALLGIEDHNELAGHPVVGASWEGLVIENLLGVAPSRTQASFYRSAAGAEIDLVLDLPKRGGWAIEIKRGLATPPAKGFYLACEDLKPDRRFVVYAGNERYALGPKVEAIGVKMLAEMVEGAQRQGTS